MRMPARTGIPPSTNHVRRRIRNPVRFILLPLFGLTAAWPGCRGAGNPIPPRNGPLTLELRYPEDGLLLSQDSTGVWGTLGTGRASLEVNGRRIRVEPNGAFADFVPLPEGDTVVLEFVARRGEEQESRRLTIPRRAAPAAEGEERPPRPYGRWVRLRRLPSDTVDSATQARPIFTRWRPGGSVAFSIPQGIRVFADARTDDQLRLRVAPDLLVWIPEADADTLGPPRTEPLPLRDLRIAELGGETEVSLAIAEPIPSQVESVPGALVWTLFGGEIGPVEHASVAGVVRAVTERDALAGRTEIELRLAEDALGWKVEWRDGRLRLRIRDRSPLRNGLGGLVIVLDPGHPPAGTIGADGLREDSMTLAVAHAAAARLRSLGARPVLTREDDSAISPEARIAHADRVDAHVFVSIHGNSPGPGRPPVAVLGTMVYWLQPNAFTLGRALLDEVSLSMAQRPIALLREDLAVIRPTWFPAVLVEGTGMIIPEREAFLRTQVGIDAYANGIVEGLERWAARDSAGADPKPARTAGRSQG